MTRFLLTVLSMCFVMVIASGAIWTTPQNMGATVNSSSNDAHPTVSANGSFIIFESNRPGGQGAHDLWISDSNGTMFQLPTNMGTNVNTTADEYGPYLAQGGTRLFWSSSYAGGSFGGLDIWSCPMSGGDPGIRVNAGAGINTTYTEASPVVTTDGNTMYFCSDRPGTSGGQDIYVSVMQGGSWQTPVNLGSIVNSSSNEEPMWISDDGNTLVFISNRPGGSYGGYDLWSTLKSGSSWGTPVNLGSPLNSASDERGASFQCNHGVIGGFLYFGSTRAGGIGAQDLWLSTESGSITVEPQSLGIIRASFH